MKLSNAIKLCALLSWSSLIMADIYEQDFELSTAPGWEPQAKGSWKVLGNQDNHYYQAKAKRGSIADEAYVSTYSGAEYQDLDYRVLVKNNNTYPSFALIRASADFYRNRNIGAGTGYAFGIRADCIVGEFGKEFRIFKQVNGSLIDIATWTPSDKLHCSNKGNRMRITAVGSTLNFF